MNKILLLLLGFFLQTLDLEAKVFNNLDRIYLQKIHKTNSFYNKLSSNLENSGFFQIKNLHELNLAEEEKKFFKDTGLIFKINRFDPEDNYLYFYYKKTFAIRVNLDEILNGSLNYLGDEVSFLTNASVNENYTKFLLFFKKFETDEKPLIKPKIFAKSLALYIKLISLNDKY